MMRRGQAALEFLTTYGWAFMVILVAIGALSYIGVTNPERFIPEKCVFPQGLQCIDSQVTTEELRVFLSNDFGQSIVMNVVDFEIRNVASGGSIHDACLFYDAERNPLSDEFTVSATQRVELRCSLIDNSVGADSKARLDVVGEYRRTSGQYKHPIRGELVVTVLEGSSFGSEIPSQPEPPFS